MPSHIFRLRLVLMLTVLIVLGSGCANWRPSATDYSVRQIAPGRQNEAFQAALGALSDRAIGVGRLDPDRGTIFAEMLNEPLDEEPGASGFGLSRRGAGRRAVDIRVKALEDATGIFCRVAIQEQASGAFRMFEVTRSGDDTPHDTAIDRDAATTTEQNTIWRNLRRDKRAEREILEAILGRLGE